MASISDNNIASNTLSINDLREMYENVALHDHTAGRMVVHPDAFRFLEEQEHPVREYGRSVNVNAREVYCHIRGMAAPKVEQKYKGILTMSLEMFLESIGIMTSDVEVGGIEFRRDNDTIEVYIRSKERVIPIGTENRINLMVVREGEEIPRVVVETPE